MAVFRVTRDGTDEVDAVYDVDPLTDTANPFGDYAVVKIDDRGGNKFQDYRRGTRIDIGVSPFNGLSIVTGETVTTSLGGTDRYTTVANAGTYETQGTVEATAEGVDRFTGYVVERRETEQGGADALEVEAYSFDQFLRRNTVSNDQTGNTISDALADIIQTDTPVTYNVANVEVGDDQELTRGYQGEPVENVLRDLAFKSNNEDFGVNDDLEFFFRPRETVHIDRGIDNTQWFNYDIPELGKEAINEVEVWFDDGDESVIVDDGTDKLDLQDNLDLPSPGTQRAELNRPLITDISDAEDEGRKYLAFRNATLSGTVTTFGLFDAEPGDTIDIEIAPRGIDEEFVIAAIEYRWGVDQTILTIIEKRGDVDDILTDLSDSVQRVEMNGADRDAPKNRITTTNATALIDSSTDADGNTPDDARVVNDGRRAVRDAWTGDSPPDIDTLVVGDDGTGLSRSNTALNSQTNSAALSQTLPDATSVEFSATITQTGVEELGVEAADGTLIMRAVFDAPVDLAGTVTVTLSVDNDPDVSRGVITTDGQTAVRDVLADNSPTLPNAYGYGDDGTAVAESDSALGNELVDVSLTSVEIQSADTQAEWDAITSLSQSDQPITTANNRLEMQQSAWTVEAEDYDSGNAPLFTSPEYSGDSPTDGEGYAIEMESTGDFAEWEFTTGYDIGAGDFSIYIREDDSFQSGDTQSDVEVFFDNTSLGTFNRALGLQWVDILTDSNISDPGAVDAGSHTLRLECVSGGSGSVWRADVVAPLDNRFTYTFDNSVTVYGSGTALDGPELYPDTFDVSLSTATTRRNITEATFTSSWNDTSEDQFIELANDGSTFTRFNNTASDTVTFASADRDVDTNFRLSRWGSQTVTPAQGFNGQYVDTWTLDANPDATVSDDISETLSRAIVPPNTIDGKTVREAGLKSGSNLLTRHEIAEFSVLVDQRIASAETTQFDQA